MTEVPDGTAVRTALWRARHVELDAAPHRRDARRWFAERPDGPWPARGEDLLLATT